MSFGDNNGNGPRPIGDPTISGRFDDRTPNEQRFTDFPNNPDLYGHIDPLATQNDRNAPPHRKRDPPLGNFAPPGQFPAGFAPNNPNRGIDGQGGLIVTDPLMIGGGGPGRGGRNGGQPQIRGDLDMMVANGVVPPGPRLQGQYGGLGGFDEMDEMGLPPPGRGGRGGFGDLPGMGGPRGGFGGMPGMGGLGGPRGGFGGGFGF